VKKMFIFALLLCAVGRAEVALEPTTSELRKEYLRRAQVWKATDVAKMNILEGPQNEVSASLDAVVECEYVEPKKQLTGVIPKFLCKTTSGNIVRVKYGIENKEIYSEAVASRLFWALGFYSDDVYPVQVKCGNCPENPFKPDLTSPRGNYIFKDATVERQFPGVSIEEKEDQGWTWKELEMVKSEGGGASRAQLDALRLLTVFIQDSDTKPDNQRLACFKDQIVDPDGNGKGSCKQSIAMIQDLGASFGSGFSGFTINKMDLNAWKEKKLWNTALEARTRTKTGTGVCIGNITSSNLAGQEGLTDPVITEAGRKFLAGLLSQLTDQQIYDLFRIARVERLEAAIEGKAQKGIINEWVAAFKEKRAEIQDRTCGEENN
jgi:hypothetical protein